MFRLYLLRSFIFILTGGIHKTLVSAFTSFVYMNYYFTRDLNHSKDIIQKYMYLYEDSLKVYICSYHCFRHQKKKTYHFR